MFYNEGFLIQVWEEYLAETGVDETQVDPDAFIRSGYARLIEWRAPRYRAIAKNWGCSIPAADIETVETADDFLDLVDAAMAKD